MSNIGIHTSAMLVELSISNWTGMKIDRRASQEVDVTKGTKVAANTVHKKLFAGTQELDESLVQSVVLNTMSSLFLGRTTDRDFYRHHLSWTTKLN